MKTGGLCFSSTGNFPPRMISAARYGDLVSMLQVFFCSIVKDISAFLPLVINLGLK